ncbi:metallophosphoesterase [Thiothrix lacustris]|uniref:Metallophosphoesterase n=1 Tax=Thiothrix lacustris TaxID=525917 RepID=A0ABY9MKH9_9GAMM|nr:metallophosphoesterase [Thiothrix lacustris]WML89189.1 metallophosphoesterase [Thiothrix lacustris]WMP19211.1 metallophosphoesterase [Thiothrix lacustris]
MLKSAAMTPQRVLNRIGRMNYFHDDRHAERTNEIRWLVEEFVEIPVKNLPLALEGFTIVQLTDMHLRPYTQVEHIQRAVEKTNALKPDLVVLTGDYVWHDGEDILDLVPVLAGLNARYGVFAVMGNHDIKTDPVLIEETFAKHGIPVLRNDGLDIQHDGGLFHLAGIDDGWLGKPDIKATLDKLRGNKPVVLLAHEPDMIDWYANDERISLQLSGHTHGGQVQLKPGKPFIRPYLGRKYVQGLYRVNESWVYTSRGIGSTGLPIRRNCSPEITHVTLVAGDYYAQAA